jgi:GntR family transcriptional repressor for pyruvate dehydrogenase complex
MSPRAASAPLERRNVAQQIADALRDRIVQGSLRAGQALPSEREMAEQYEVNRSSVREALRRLEAVGLVVIRQGEPTRVQDILAATDLSLLPLLFESRSDADPALLRELHELRAMLLGWCAERAAERADAASIARLEELARALGAPGARASELAELDFQFFEMLVLVSGNRLLALFTKLVREIYAKGRERFAEMYAEGVLQPEHHRDAVRAIRARDAKAAGDAMRAHAQTAIRKETRS